MNTKSILVSLCLLASTASFGQTVLHYPYFFGLNTNDVFNTCSVQRWIDKETETSEEVKFPKGNYTIDNDGQTASFSINDSGLLNDTVRYVSKKRKNRAYTFVYDNGILQTSRTNSADGLLLTGELKDSVFTRTLYYPSGQTAEIEITDYKIKDNGRNYILTQFYETGQMQSEQNKIEQTFKTFREDGTPARFNDDKNKTGTWYYDDGYPIRKWYKTDDGYCNEYFEKGIITLKKCYTDNEEKSYNYENGKLKSYEIFDEITNERKYFDAKGKLIKKEVEDVISIRVFE